MFNAKYRLYKLVVVLGIFCGCQSNYNQVENNTENISEESNSIPGIGNNPYSSIEKIPLPAGFQRSNSGDRNFNDYMRNIHLKSDKTVYLYNGNMKGNQSAQFAVLDIPVGNRDLQQCADAVMRLRAEYLYSNNRFDEIVFYDNGNGVYQFQSPFDRNNFEKYMNRVFGMCGSASLAKQMHSTNAENLQIGDVLIRGGFPGHAVVVVDKAEKSGKKIFLLAQSYMPAQNIHILKNPMNTDLSPWYEFPSDMVNISTPEYYFTTNQFKTW